MDSEDKLLFFLYKIGGIMGFIVITGLVIAYYIQQYPKDGFIPYVWFGFFSMYVILLMPVVLWWMLKKEQKNESKAKK